MSSEGVLALVIVACMFAVLVSSYVLVGVLSRRSRRSNVATRAIEASASAGAGGNKTEASAAPCAVAGEPPKATSELWMADAHGPLVLGKEPPSHITTTEEEPMCGCSGVWDLTSRPNIYIMSRSSPNEQNSRYQCH